MVIGIRTWMVCNTNMRCLGTNHAIMDKMYIVGEIMGL